MTLSFPAAGPVFWDLDGTLLDSEPIHDASALHACALFGRHHDVLPPMPPGASAADAYRTLFGLLPHAPLPAQYEDWYAITVDYVVAHLHRASPVAGSVAFSGWLAERGVAQSVVSNSSPRIIEAAVERLGIRAHLTHLCSADDVERGKPDPAVYLRAAALHGQPPHTCVVFEDSMTGVTAARAAGMVVIAVTADAAVRERAHAALAPDDATAWERLRQAFITPSRTLRAR